MTDEELVYFYQVSANFNAFKLLKQRYNQLINNFQRKYFSKFSALPLELSDLDFISYQALVISVLTYQPTRNQSFQVYLKLQLRWKILHYLRKFTTKNNQLVNFALPFNPAYQQEGLITDYSVNAPSSFRCDLEYQLQNHINFSPFEISVLKLKWKGFSNQEICDRLNKDYKQVDNAWQRIRLKFKLVQA